MICALKKINQKNIKLHSLSSLTQQRIDLIILKEITKGTHSSINQSVPLPMQNNVSYVYKSDSKYTKTALSSRKTGLVGTGHIYS